MTAGRPPSCTCGFCRRCKEKARKARYRAGDPVARESADDKRMNAIALEWLVAKGFREEVAVSEIHDG